MDLRFKDLTQQQCDQLKQLAATFNALPIIVDGKASHKLTLTELRQELDPDEFNEIKSFGIVFAIQTSFPPARGDSCGGCWSYYAPYKNREGHKYDDYLWNVFPDFDGDAMWSDYQFTRDDILSAFSEDLIQYLKDNDLPLYCNGTLVPLEGECNMRYTPDEDSGT